jgi:hypothetical protein
MAVVPPTRNILRQISLLREYIRVGKCALLSRMEVGIWAANVKTFEVLLYDLNGANEKSIFLS